MADAVDLMSQAKKGGQRINGHQNTPHVIAFTGRKRENSRPRGEDQDRRKAYNGHFSSVR